MTSAERLVVAVTIAASGLLATGPSRGAASPAESPLLPFSTLLGGSNADVAEAAAFGPDGALWIAASSYSTDFPGAPRTSGAENGGDAVVLRFDTTTRSVLSAAWIGGTGYNCPVALAFDRNGNAFVAGNTRYGEIPATVKFGRTRNWYTNAFVARLRCDGSGYAWVALLEGATVTGMAVTSDGDPVVCGSWSSNEAPEKTFVAGDGSTFVARVRADGSALVFSIRMDGDSADAVGIAPGGAILVAGHSRSPAFASATRLCGDAAGVFDGFLAELDPSGTSVRRATHLGHTIVESIAASPDGVLLMGSTEVADFPAAPARHGSPGDPGDAFLLRLDADDWRPRAGTLFGGSNAEYYLTMSQAPDGTIWVGGSTSSSDLPVPGAFQPSLSPIEGGWFSEDAFAAAFEPRDFALLYATYLGGDKRELGNAITVAPDGAAWFAGATGSSDFPLVDSLQGRASKGPEYDMFVARLVRGDPAACPPEPTACVADAVGGNAVHLRWEEGSTTCTGFTVSRHGEEGCPQVVRLPADTTEWVDDTVLADRRYDYTVQAVNDAGGSPPSAPAEVQTPPTVDVGIDRGTTRFVPNSRDGVSRVDIRGTLSLNATATSAALDPRRDGIEWVAGTDSEKAALLSVAADDHRWKTTRRGLRWSGRAGRLALDSTTGRYELRVRVDGRLAFPVDARRMRVTIGRDSGSTSPVWRPAGARRTRTP